MPCSYDKEVVFALVDGSQPDSPRRIRDMFENCPDYASGLVYAFLDAKDIRGNGCLHRALKGIANLPSREVLIQARIAHALISLCGLDIFEKNYDGIRPIDYVTPAIGEEYGLPYIIPGGYAATGIKLLDSDLKL